eukprot:CAMPEP_0174359942 /NCGR_PEP_ID=MMETSP0811_2-20130205/51380_1 /TAXON_ID=73025 ORGANISM="Eutreptiella gymnastica-like, Strain CCMP1594" /NCGR_SAMPLE_ID=MMETSP0811_2 /ASSEMBLY_ACC=CAM_ASM_000667 /LENGTH=91 /DNA_ID=CAMNT_0015495121 /DNA_START=1 /DNA_END=276 /DNA_ORIENTATION=-
MVQPRPPPPVPTPVEAWHVGGTLMRRRPQAFPGSGCWPERWQGVVGQRWPETCSIPPTLTPCACEGRPGVGQQRVAPLEGARPLAGTWTRA